MLSYRICLCNIIQDSDVDIAMNYLEAEWLSDFLCTNRHNFDVSQRYSMFPQNGFFLSTSTYLLTWHQNENSLDFSIKETIKKNKDVAYVPGVEPSLCSLWQNKHSEMFRDRKVGAQTVATHTPSNPVIGGAEIFMSWFFQQLFYKVTNNGHRFLVRIAPAFYTSMTKCLFCRKKH